MESPIFIKEKSVGSPIIEDSLLSMERMDRSSPELWPEQIPGVSEYATNPNIYNKPPLWSKGLDSEDITLLFHLSKLAPSAFVAEVKKLHDAAYQLGLDESKEMTRGKVLKVLTKKPLQ